MKRMLVLVLVAAFAIPLGASVTPRAPSIQDEMDSLQIQKKALGSDSEYLKEFSRQYMENQSLKRYIERRPHQEIGCRVTAFFFLGMQFSFETGSHCSGGGYGGGGGSAF